MIDFVAVRDKVGPFQLLHEVSRDNGNAENRDCRAACGLHDVCGRARVFCLFIERADAPPSS